ncbi:PadR family transcriptional regulator [Aneurinibacillus terranovensis]|uniref:PadR family transcriptional regulator n=1 Tax=Aneurinibacillus terranovensis TaxID=278991 RepID=UPI00042474A8|nr:PadR family transcriptional regulator [Aneurinibacillus terranovensis]
MLCFDSVFSHFFDATYGAIYPTLNHMEKEGFITKEVVIQEGKPNKNLFFITDEGKKAFQEYLNSPVEAEVIRSDFLMRLYFGEYVDKSQLVRWIEGEIEKTENMIARLEDNYQQWKVEMTPTQEICLQFGMNHYRAHLKVLEEAVKNYK